MLGSCALITTACRLYSAQPLAAPEIVIFFAQKTAFFRIRGTYHFPSRLYMIISAKHVMETHARRNAMKAAET